MGSRFCANARLNAVGCGSSLLGVQETMLVEVPNVPIRTGSSARPLVCRELASDPRARRSSVPATTAMRRKHWSWKSCYRG